VRYMQGRLALLAIWCCLAAITSAENKGLFIGTAKYTLPGASSLPDTRFDANDMQNTMIREGMVSPDNARLLTGRNKKAAVLAAIRQQAQGMGADDTLYVYNSSHGSSNGTFLASDAAISPAELSAALTGTGADKIVFINDSCFSGKFELAIPGKQVAQLNAAGNDKVAWSSTTALDDMGHVNGVLTKYLVDGLRDGAADTNGDGEVTVGELGAWASHGAKNSENDYADLHDYDNNVTTQGPNASGDDFTLNREKPDEKFKGMRLVPHLVGQNLKAALANLKKDDLTGTQSAYIIPNKDWMLGEWAGKVYESTPRPGTRVMPYSSVALKVVDSKAAAMPNLIGKTVAEAKAALAAVGFKAWVLNPGQVADHIGYQYPSARKMLVAGSWVELHKREATDVGVPWLTCRTRARAEEMLRDVGLVASVRIRRPFGTSGSGVDSFTRDLDSHPPFKWAGKVWAQVPHGKTKKQKGETVTIYVAPSPAADVPYLMGLTQAEAGQKLIAAGLQMRFWRAESRMTTANPSGVIKWAPQPQAYKGDRIRVAVEFPKIPNIVGKTEAEARAACVLAKLRFLPQTKDIPTAREFGKVVEQLPVAGGHTTQGAQIVGTLPKLLASLKVVVSGKEKQKPVDSAELTLAGPKPAAATATGGQHSFAGLTKGSYTLTAKKKGYLAATQQVSIDPKLNPSAIVQIVLELDPDVSIGDLTVSVVTMKGKPASEIARDARFMGIVSQSSLPKDLKIGKVEWVIISPSGKKAKSKKGRSGKAGLTIVILPQHTWPLGKYGLQAIVHTEKETGEGGILTGTGSFVLKESDFLRFELKTPIYTGQWSSVRRIHDLPFEIKDAARLRITGLGDTTNSDMWKLKGRRLSFRPLKPGVIQPSFRLEYVGEKVKCRTTVRVRMTEMGVVIDWEKPIKRGKELRVPFTLLIPGDFETPFEFKIDPKRVIDLKNSPRKSGKGYKVTGEVLLDKLGARAKIITIDLADKTGAVAQAILSPDGIDECSRPPAKVLRIMKKFSNPQAMMGQMNAAQGNEGKSSALARQFSDDAMTMMAWIAGLKKCKHVSARARNAYGRMVKALRKHQRGALSEAAAKALERELTAAARALSSLRKSDFKPGFMRGVMEK
jgi:beta-lactam-binding protein with PASTA domain